MKKEYAKLTPRSIVSEIFFVFSSIFFAFWFTNGVNSAFVDQPDTIILIGNIVKDILVLGFGLFALTSIVSLFAQVSTIRKSGQIASSIENEPEAWRSRDVTTQVKAIPDAIKETVSQLNQLGFRALGAADVKDARTFVFLDNTGLIFATIMVVEEHETYSNDFHTVFKDRAYLGTSTHSGRDYIQPMHKHYHIPHDIEAAFTHQRKQITGLIPEHGQPMRLKTMANYIKWDHYSTSTYDTSYLRHAVRWGWIAIIFYGIVAAATLIGLVMVFSRNPSPYFIGFLVGLVISMQRLLVQLGFIDVPQNESDDQGSKQANRKQKEETI